MSLLVHSRSALLCNPSTRASANSFAGIHIRVYILGVTHAVTLTPCHISLVRHHADTSERNSREYDTLPDLSRSHTLRVLCMSYIHRVFSVLLMLLHIAHAGMSCTYTLSTCCHMSHKLHKLHFRHIVTLCIHSQILHIATCHTLRVLCMSYCYRVFSVLSHVAQVTLGMSPCMTLYVYLQVVYMHFMYTYICCTYDIKMYIPIYIYLYSRGAVYVYTRYTCASKGHALWMSCVRTCTQVSMYMDISTLGDLQDTPTVTWCILGVTTLTLTKSIHFESQTYTCIMCIPMSREYTRARLCPI